MLSVAILAGGLGTRLGPLTEKVPKALVPVNGEPFLAHQLRLLARSGIERVVLCIAHQGAAIRKWVADGGQFGPRVDFSEDGSELLGTAGAVRNALPLLEEAFFVLYGDSYLPCDYRAAAAAFARCGQPALMTVFRNEGRWDASNVELAGGQIVAYDKIHRTPRMRHIDYGLGVFRRSVFERLPATGRLDLAAVYGGLLGRGELACHEVSERFYEIGSWEGVRELSAYLGGGA